MPSIRLLLIIAIGIYCASVGYLSRSIEELKDEVIEIRNSVGEISTRLR